MAENKDGQEKTEDATSRRLSDARDKGQISKSADVTTASIILFGGLLTYSLGGPMMNSYKNFMAQMLANSTKITITDQNVTHYFFLLVTFMASILLPVLFAIFAVTVAAEVAQVGFTFATKKFTEGLRWEQIFNPFKGMKRIFFSSHSFFELGKSLLKMMLIGLVVYWVLSERQVDVLALVERPFEDFAPFMASISFELVWKVGVSYITIAAADYFWQKWKYKTDMKMTKKEVKDELKQSDGDPMMKSRIRSIMRSRIRKMMMQNATKADVVIVNPTHFAVALRYKQGESNAPVVVAKGLDYLALKIRSIAEEHDIPIVEEPPLARTLYKMVDIDEEIPDSLFKAVAEVLAYVYQMKKEVSL